jgi:hypothetical protein
MVFHRLKGSHCRAMARRIQSIAKLRKVARVEPDTTHLEALEQELYLSTNDRAVVVLMASFVEEHVRRLLKAKLRADLSTEDSDRLFDYQGPFGSFAARTLSAYAMGLIGPIVRSDLDLIRNLRNEFAHSRVPIDFKTPEVRAVCDDLKIVDMPGTYVPRSYLERVRHEDLKDATDRKHPKTRFVTACHTIAYRISLKQNGPREGDVAFPDDEPVP